MKRGLRRTAALMASAIPLMAGAQDHGARDQRDLRDLSLEELSHIEVTSVLRREWSR